MLTPPIAETKMEDDVMSGGGPLEKGRNHVPNRVERVNADTHYNEDVCGRNAVTNSDFTYVNFY